MSKIKPMAVVAGFLAGSAALADNPYSLSTAWRSVASGESISPFAWSRDPVQGLASKSFRLRHPGAALGLRNLAYGAGGPALPAVESFRPLYLDHAAGLLVGLGTQSPVANRWALVPAPGRHALHADVYKRYGAATAFASLGRMGVSDTAASGDLRDPWFTSLGVAYRLTARTSAGLSYDFRQKLWDDGGRVSEGGAFVSYRLAPSMRLQGYAVTGLTDASPGWGVGANFSLGF